MYYHTTEGGNAAYIPLQKSLRGMSKLNPLCNQLLGDVYLDTSSVDQGVKQTKIDGA